jgi:peptidoglycan/xylan/chitin deacetylase (PgdA/CDA1 family)
MIAGRRVIARTASGPLGAAAASVLERIGRPRSNTFAVLTYHRVDEPTARPWLYPFLLSATPQGFEEQMAMVRSHYRAISLPELLAAQRGERTLPRRAILITFDDGYRDFRENAWPILKRLGLPVTLFVPTAYPSAPTTPFWWDRLWSSVANAAAGAVVTTAEGRVELGAADRTAEARRLVELHKSLDHDAAMRSVDAICRQLGEGPPRTGVLDWDDLRALAAEGVHIAPHSRTHPLLTRIGGDELRAELQGSRADLQVHLSGQGYGFAFAYPAGQVDDRATAALAELDFELAFTTGRGVNRLGDMDPLLVRRINVSLRATPGLIRSQVAFLLLRHRLLGN